jgi:hypothetical protein
MITDKRKFPVMLLAVLILTITAVRPTAAEYWGMVDAPEWQASENYTRQSWGFDTDPDWYNVDSDGNQVDPEDPNVDTDVAFIIAGDGYAADEALVNSHGGAFFIRTYYGDSFSWDWSDEGPMGQDWIGLQGLPGGMGQGSFDFRIHVGTLPPDYSREIWLQYVVFIPNAGSGADLVAQLAFDSDFTAPIVSDPNMKRYEQIHELDDQGQTGNWWRVTEVWQVTDARDPIYLRVNTDVEGTANLLDSVDVITRVVNPPVITATLPGGGDSGIPVDTVAAINFNKSMDTASTREAFSIVPAVSGAFSWSDLDSVMTFTPDALLSIETEYTVTVGTGAQDPTGTALGNAVAFSFTTEAYQPPAPAIEGGFSGTVNEDTVTLTIGGSGIYRYRYRLDDGDWSETRSLGELTLEDLADGEHTLDIQVLDGHSDWIGTDPIIWTVMAPPRIVAVSPRGNVADPETVTVTFNEAMEKSSVEQALEIDPPVTGSFSWEEEDTWLVFTVDQPLEADSNYTVTIGNLAADLAGNTLAQPFIWTFTTLPENTVNCPVTADTYVLFGGMGDGVGYPQGSSLGEMKLKAGAVSIVDARALMRFDLTNITDLGLTAEDIVTANLVYTMLEGTDGMDVGPPAPAGTAMYGFVHVLATDTREKTGETVDPFFWTENVQGQGEGYVDMRNKPWYESGAPYALASHRTGPNTSGRVDIAPIVRGWLDGRWDNNGIELRDHDDRSNPDSEWGDGYSWHMTSKGNTDDPPPYLEVVYDTERLRIIGRTSASATMQPGDERLLTAGGGDPNDYRWQAIGPDASILSDTALSATSGATTTFTAPDLSGPVIITLTSGEESDQVFIGIGNPVEYDKQDQAPLYATAGVPAESICSDVLDQMGQFSSLARIALDDGGGETRIGGTGLDGGAAMAIIDIPAVAAPITLETLDKQEVLLEIVDAGSARYAVVADTGGESPGGATGIYLFELFDQNGAPLAANAIGRLRITLPYDAAATGSAPFDSGAWKIVHAPDLETFFSGDPDAAVTTVPDTDIVAVDETSQTVTFETTHCSVFGVVSGSDVEWEAGEDESLGGGCFINSLLPRASAPRP